METIQLYEFQDGFGLYEKKSENRLKLEVFKKLIKYLKSRFLHEYVVELFPNQGGYVFFTTSISLRIAISNFLASL